MAFKMRMAVDKHGIHTHSRFNDLDFDFDFENVRLVVLVFIFRPSEYFNICWLKSQ